MPNTVFSANQRQAMEYLGYKRWLVRQTFAQWHHAQASESGEKSRIHEDGMMQSAMNGSRVNSMTSILPSAMTQVSHANVSSPDKAALKRTISAPDSQPSSRPDDEPSEALAQSDDKATAQVAVEAFQLDNLSVSLSKAMTLLTWQSTLTQRNFLMAMPPLWGASDALTLFATELEGALFDNALRVCGLGEIADKVAQAADFIRMQTSTLKLADVTINNTPTDSKTMVIIVNAALPSLEQFKVSMANDAGLQVATLIHPYDCLQNPQKKAKLWQQLMNLQVKL